MVRMALIFCGIIIIGPVSAQQLRKNIKEITIKVQDPTGANIDNAYIKNSVGGIIGTTNEIGEVNLTIRAKYCVTVGKDGFEDLHLNVSTLRNNDKLILKPCLQYNSKADVIPLPRNTISKRYSTGDYFVITGEELQKYPTLDLRNALVGLIPGLDVTELDGSTGTSSEEMTGNYGASIKVRLQGRGSFSPLWIIDDIPIDITEMQLDPEEIETITFVKDAVGKATYGPTAANGIIYVKTRQGEQNQQSLKVNIESGFSKIDRFPEFVGGADYAKLNNLARSNSGLAPQYSMYDIEKFALNDPYSMTHPDINFKKMMLKDTKPYYRMNLSSKGGNQIVQYYTNIGYAHEGDIYSIGSTAKYDRINARANLNVNINQYIKLRGNLFAGLSLRNSPNYGYSSEDIQEFTSVIDDITKIAPVAFPVYAYSDNKVDFNRYAVSSLFDTNPIGNLVDNGYYTETGRSAATTFMLDIDLSKIIKGLSSHTIGGFNVMNLIRIGKKTQYASYIVTPNFDRTDVNIELKQLSTDMSEQTKLHDYYWQRYIGSQQFNYSATFGKHQINSSLNYYLSKLTRDGITNPFCQQGGSLTATYTYADKYTLNGVLAYDGTQRIIGNNQYTFSPALGASWIIMDKDLDKSESFVDFLKLRGEWGNVAVENSRTPSLYQYQDNWSSSTGSTFGPHSTNRWQGNTQETSPYKTNNGRIGNPNLNWERQNEFSVGIDMLMFNKQFAANISYYNIKRYNSLVTPSDMFPLVTGIMSVPQINYGDTRYDGLELNLKYKNQIGKFNYSIGTNFTYQHSKVLKKSEPDYRFDYQSRIGQAADAYYGLVYSGKFATDEDTKFVPQIFDESLSAGDLKYADLNNDGIVDDNDQKCIGHTLPRLYYGLNLTLGYRNFSLYILANGRAAYDVALTNRYFQNGWGDNNYSAFVRDNIDSDYPRLTYYKVNNNFKGSSYWLRDGSYFKIQNIELSYTVPAKNIYTYGIQGIKVFVTGSNLLTISKLKDVDPESIDSGISNYPLFRTFTAGIKLSF